MDKNKEVKGQNNKKEGAGTSTARVSSKKSKTAFSVSNFLAGNKTESKKAIPNQTTITPETPKAQPAKAAEASAKKSGVVANIYNSKRKGTAAKAQPAKQPVSSGPVPQMPRSPYGAAYPNGIMPQNPYYAGQPMPQNPYGAPVYPNGMPYGYPYGPLPQNPYYMGQPNPYMQNNGQLQAQVNQPSSEKEQTKTRKQQKQEEPEEEIEEYSEEQTEQERLKEQTLNYFAERTWTRKPKEPQEDDELQEPLENEDDLNFDKYLEDLEDEGEEALEDKAAEEKEEQDEIEKAADEDLLDEEELEEKEEVNEAQEETEAQEGEEQKPEENAEEAEPTEKIKAENEDQKEQKEEKKPEPKAISKLDYFKYRFVDNTAVGTQGKARVEELATRFGARRDEETNAGFIASKDGKDSKIEEVNGFNKEEINLDFSKRGSVKVYKNNKGLSVASIFFALIYVIGAVVAFMMLGVPTKEAAKVVAMSIDVASDYVKYAEIGETINLENYTLTLTNEDGTTTIVKANNRMVTSWPDCVDKATYKVKSLGTNAKIRIAYNDSIYKTITLTTYQFEISDACYTITDGGASIDEDLSNVLVYINYVAKDGDGNNIEINGQTLIKQQQLPVSTTPNQPGYVSYDSGTSTYKVYINAQNQYYTLTKAE